MCLYIQAEEISELYPLLAKQGGDEQELHKAQQDVTIDSESWKDMKN